MKVLLIHNRYKEAGGEDAVFQAERTLLSQNGNFVEALIFDNRDIKGWLDKFLAGVRLIYNLVTLHNYRLICPGYTLFHNGKIYEKSIGSLFPLDAIAKGVYRNSRFQTAAVAVMTAIHSLIGTWKNRVSLYITLTEFSRRKFASAAISIPEARLVVKPNFIRDVGRGDATRKKFFLFVGRLVEEKGVLSLLNATRLSEFELVIIGDGPLAPIVKEYAAGNPNIHWLGFRDNATVIQYMKSCKALIFPSLWYECFPIALLEAFATGTVVIASRLGAMAEIIRDRVNGLHFTAGDTA